MATTYVDFSARDFTARFQALLDLLTTECPQLTDRNHSDAGISILRLLSREVDQLNYLLDSAFAEGFVPSANFMQSLIDISATTDYRAKLASAASTTLTFTRVSGFTSTLVIPQYTQVSRTDGINYATAEEITLLSGTTSVDVDALQGTVKSVVINPSDFVSVDNSGYVKFNLGANVAAGSVIVDNDYVQVDTLWRHDADETCYILELYADKYDGGVANTVFLTVQAAPIVPLTVTYLACDGPNGNTGAGTITGISGTYNSDVTCTNSLPATGGAWCESIEKFRARLPEITRTQRRAVITDDYNALVKAIPGVADCKAFDRNYSDIFPHFYVFLYVLPEGGGELSDNLKADIYSILGSYGHLGNWTNRYILRSAQEQPVNVSVRIGLTGNSNSTTVTNAVGTAVGNVFANLMIGEQLRFSDIIITTNKVSGVSWAEISTPTEDIIPSLGTVLVPGTIDISVG